MKISFYMRDYNDLVDVMINDKSNCFRIDNGGLGLWGTSHPQDGVDYVNKNRLMVIGVDEV
jgi:hypothetical protein